MKKILYVALLAMFLVSCDEGYNNNPSDENSNQSSSNESGNDSGDKSDDGPFIPAFSVSEDKQVIFSPGNLQYHPKYNKWRFAENQTDYIGDANSNCSATYNGWLDLFGWGTGANPTLCTKELTDYSAFVDWGTNPIGNDAPNTWRTLTYKEWKYLLEARDNASSLIGIAQVNGINGLILLPDNWICPSGVTFTFGCHSIYGLESYTQHQTFDDELWHTLESTGAVFLPTAGYRWEYNVYQVVVRGYYWSATDYNSDLALAFGFKPDEAFITDSERYIGNSVRLVKDL